MAAPSSDGSRASAAPGSGSGQREERMLPDVNEPRWQPAGFEKGRERAAGIPRGDTSVITDQFGRVMILSDTHFWHRNIVADQNRPSNHTEVMMYRWRKTVSEDDILLHLGDIVHGISLGQLAQRFPDLPPKRKFLLLGNHDSAGRIAIFMDHGWQVLDPFEARYGGVRLFFTHEPLEEVPPGAINVHGHLHNRPAPSDRHINVSVEQLDYRPHRLVRLLAQRLGGER